MFNTKKFVIVCACMAGAGLLLSAAGFAMGGRVWGVGLNQDGIYVNMPNRISGDSGSYVEKTLDLEQFDSMDVSIAFGDLIIEPADHYGISYCVNETCDFSAEVVDGSLKVTKKYNHQVGIWDFGMTFFGYTDHTNLRQKDEYVKIYIPPEQRFDSVVLYNESGKVTVSNFYAKNFQLDAAFGDAKLAGVSSQDANIIMESGNLELVDYADGKLTITNQFGKTKLDNIKASDVSLSAESGDVKVSQMQANRLVLNQQFGDVVLAEAQIAEETEVQSESGDIKLTDIKAKTLDLTCKFGAITGKGVEAESGTVEVEGGDCQMDAANIKDLDISSQFGKVKLGIPGPLTDYTYELKTEYGTIKMNDKNMGETYQSIEDAQKKLKVICESGDIVIKQNRQD